MLTLENEGRAICGINKNSYICPGAGGIKCSFLTYVKWSYTSLETKTWVSGVSVMWQMEHGDE